MRGYGGARPVTPALAAGLTALCLCGFLLLLGSIWAALPPAVFVGLCAAAPFCPAWGFFLPVVSRGPRGKAVVCVTFDDGPDPATTPLLLQLLERQGAKAAFFVTGERAGRHGALIAAILAGGHDIGNHSFHHDPFLMLRRTDVLRREIKDTQEELRDFGISPLAFRPPVGVTSPRLAAVLEEQGLRCVTFSCRAPDWGNRQIGGMARKILRKVRPGDIILLHDTRPTGAATPDAWLKEIEDLLEGLKMKGLPVVPLAELIGAPVMSRSMAAGARGLKNI